MLWIDFFSKFLRNTVTGGGNCQLWCFHRVSPIVHQGRVIPQGYSQRWRNAHHGPKTLMEHFGKCLLVIRTFKDRLCVTCMDWGELSVASLSSSCFLLLPLRLPTSTVIQVSFLDCPKPLPLPQSRASSPHCILWHGGWGAQGVRDKVLLLPQSRLPASLSEGLSSARLAL